MTGATDIPFTIRGFRPADAAACKTLYVEGLIGGRLADNDTAYDLEDIEAAYLKSDGNHFWVAVAPPVAPPVEPAAGAAGACEQVVGMIGVQQHDRGVGEVRRLRVARPFRRRGIGGALVETALRFCREREYLKITLDTFLDREPAVRLFQKFGFRHARTRRVGGKDLMYFYLDLYTGRPAGKE